MVARLGLHFGLEVKQLVNTIEVRCLDPIAAVNARVVVAPVVGDYEQDVWPLPLRDRSRHREGGSSAQQEIPA